MRTMLLAPLLLAGCAAQPTITERVMAASDIDVCEAAFYGPAAVKTAVAVEIEHRRLNCQAMLPLIQARHQQDAQMRAQALGVLLGRPSYQPAPAMQPYQMQVPKTTNCTSQWVGNQVQTVCR